MKVRKDVSYRVAVVRWQDDDGIAEAIHRELLALGHCPSYFPFDGSVPEGVDVVFTFAPYGKLLQIPGQYADRPFQQRPTFVHWNTEGIPDLRIPWTIVNAVGAWRSWIGRLGDSKQPTLRALSTKPPLNWADHRMLRFRYVGDYHYAYRKAWLDVFADSSQLYADIHSRHGLPTVYAPWGATPGWYDDLGLERDIDVLWMGKRGSKRRSDILDRVRGELQAKGVQMYFADNVENPFIFNDERTNFLNRAKITINVTRTWFDDNFSRFAIAAPNRSLIVSEPVLPHCPEFEAGVHYVSASIDHLAETIIYYLEHPEEYERIVDNAYELVTTKLAFGNSISAIMGAVNTVRENGRSPGGSRSS